MNNNNNNTNFVWILPFQRWWIFRSVYASAVIPVSLERTRYNIIYECVIAVCATLKTKTIFQTWTQYSHLFVIISMGKPAIRRTKKAETYKFSAVVKKIIQKSRCENSCFIFYPTINRIYSKYSYLLHTSNKRNDCRPYVRLFGRKKMTMPDIASYF